MMEYNFFADLLTTFRSSSDFIKALIVLGFYGSLLGGFLGYLHRPRSGGAITAPKLLTLTRPAPAGISAGERARKAHAKID